MSLNGLFMKWMAAIFGVTFLLVGAVIAHDRDITFIDHFLDFHVDTERILEDGEREHNQRSRAHDHQSHGEQWAKEVRDFGRDDRSGPDGPPGKD